MKTIKRAFCGVMAVALLGGVLASCAKQKPAEETEKPAGSYQATQGTGYTIPLLDLSVKPDGIDEKYNYLYQNTVLDDTENYVAHPDSVLLNDGKILTVYPLGHGKGSILSKISTDGGLSWSESLQNTPKSWKKSEETPTIYRLRFTDGKTGDKLVLISANPKWGKAQTKGGFNCSVSTDEGATWSEFELFHGKKSPGGVSNTIVAMASLTQLKENGQFVDKWMGLFHDNEFYNYQSILTFDGQGNPQWSEPVRYFEQYRDAETQANMCEVEVIRSEGGQGGQLCLIGRSNSKQNNSILSFSNDEGKTWSKPIEVPAALNGERHKAEYTADGRLFITFRSIERSAEAIAQYAANDADAKTRGWYSEGWIGWVGTYEDLVNGNEGQYRVKIAHTYLNSQTEPVRLANADTGYCGNVVLPDGTIVTSSYGCFDPQKSYKKNGETVYKTSIVSKRINLQDTDALVRELFPDSI